jgi:hypothetical protein
LTTRHVQGDRLLVTETMRGRYQGGQVVVSVSASALELPASPSSLLAGRGAMSNDKALIPVWTLATGDVQIPSFADDGPMTAGRLAELRSVLAALADSPIATLEVHPLPDNLDRPRGIPLDAGAGVLQAAGSR